MRNPSIEPLEARIAPAVLSIAGPASLTEGNNGKSDMTFTVVLDEPSPTAITVRVDTLNGTATVADGDYDPFTSFTLSIPANTALKTFVVKVNGDTQFEPDQTFSVALSNPSAGHSLGTATATGTILADSDALPKLSVAAASRVEGNSGTADMEFTVTLTNAASEPITFEWNTRDALTGALATAGTDYTAVPEGTVATIPAGETSVKLRVPIIGDRIKAGDDSNEVFAVFLQNPTLGATALDFSNLNSNTAIGTILNDEPNITVEFAMGQSAQPSEGNSGQTTVNFIAKLSVAASQSIDVFVSTIAGTASAGSDFTAIDNQQFTIAAGQTQITVPVRVMADRIFEDNESFSLQLVGATMNGATIDYSTTPLAVTIANDESVPTISLKAATTVVPASGTKAMNFSVNLSGALDRDVTFSWSTMGDTATADVDYMTVTNLVATIPAGQTSVLLPVTIFADADAANEQFRVSIAAPNFGSLGTSSALGTIRTSSLGISVISPVPPITEGTTGPDRDAIFRITRGGTDINTPVTVRVSTVDGTATAAGGDYDAVSGVNISLPAGVNETTFVVKVNPDNRHEADEVFSLRIDSLEINGADFDGIVAGTATASIINDDSMPAMSVGDMSASEGSTVTRSLSFVVTLSTAADTDVTFDYVTALIGSASAGDFAQVLTPVTVTIPAGQTSRTVSIDLTGDVERESSETFLVRISNQSFGTILDDSGAMTILDDEPVISISAPAPIVEGSTVNGTTNATFTVSLDKAALENIAVRVATSNGSALAGFDYDAFGTIAEKWLVIPAGSRTGTIVVPVLHDATSERAETFNLNVVEAKVGVNAALDVNGLPVNGVALPQGFIQPATATITDDDAISLSINDASVVEGNAGNHMLTFTVSIPKAADRDVTFSYGTFNNTAVAGQDFVGVSSAVGTIPAGSTNAQIAVTVFGDSVGEADETLTVSLSNATVGTDVLAISDAFGTGSILNDEHTVSISQALTVAENIVGGRAVLSLSLSSASAFPVTVTIALTDGTAKKGMDYLDPASLNVTIPAGQTSASISIPITNDTGSEGNETFTVTMITAINAELASLASSSVTIVSEDGPSRLTVSNVTVAEANPAGAADNFVDMTFTATLDKASGTPVSFDWETLSGSPFTATPGADFTAVSLTTLTIPANTTSKTFVVKVKKDLIHESDETLGVRVFNVLDAELFDGTGVTTSRTVTGTITNDDSAPLVSVSDTRLLEGAAGAVNADFVVTLSRATDRDVTFLWRTATGGTNPAAEGVDFTGITAGTLVTILAGQTTATLTVVLNGDTDVEVDETFLVQIVDPRLVLPSDPHVAGAGIAMTGGDLEALGTIRNDDTLATIQPTVSTTEGDGLVEVRIPVTLSQPVPAGQTATVGFEVIAGSGAGGASILDYEVPTSTVITFAAGETTKDITVRLKADAISELNETFSVRLRDVTSQNVLVQSGVNDTSVVTIADNDALPAISISNAGAVENAGTITFVIKLSHESSTPVTVMTETLDGTAISSGLAFDFTSRSLETITILPGSTSANYTVSIRSDSDASESVENFFVHLSSQTNGTLTDGDATGSIVESNIGALSISNVSMAEGNSATPSKMRFTVTRSGSTDLAATADYTINFTGTANAADFAIPSELSGTVTIPAGLASKSFEVSISGDLIVEGDETFNVTLSNLHNAFARVDADLKATGTIAEDDLTVAFVNSADVLKPKVFSITEGNSGTSDLSFGITLNQIATTDVVVTFSVNGGTATSGVDFVNPANLKVTIPAGQLTGSFVVSVIGDNTAEGSINGLLWQRSETFTVSIVSATAATVVGSENSRTGEIVNDDAAFRILDGARVIEGNSGTRNLVFEVELADGSFIAGTEYTVDFATSNLLALAGQDYTAQTGTLTFTANGTKTVSVPVLGDIFSENDETLRLTISNAKLNGTAISGILDSEATGTIQDDEALVSIGNATVTEGDAGQQQMIFVVSMPTTAPYPVTISFITIDGTARGAAPGVTDLVGRDFRGVTAGSLTIPAGQNTAQISIAILGDNVDEAGGETFLVKLTSVTGAAFIDDEGLGTITEDADPLPQLSIADAQLLETDAGSPIMKFRVSLSAAANADVTFNWSTATGTANGSDFSSVSNVSATIPVGAQFIDIEVPLTADTLAEGNEKFTVTVSNAQRGATVIAISDAVADGTILDDDAFIHIALADDEVTFTEDDGAATPTGSKVRVRLDVDPVPGEFSVTYTLTTPTLSTDVAATSGTDYTPPTTLTKTFPAGTLASDMFLEVDLKADAIDEWDEKFVVTLVSASGVKLDSTPENLQSVVTVTDNDAAPTLEIPDITTSESSTQAGFIVRLVGNVTERAITIRWETVSGTALAVSDFTARANQTLSIPAGNREGIITVAVVNDSLDETDEQFFVALTDSNFTQGAMSEAVVRDPVATATISQNDLRTVSVLGGTITEGAAGTSSQKVKFTIRLDAAPSSTPVKVNYSTLAATAFSGADFISTIGQVIFQPGESAKDVFVDVVSDDVAEVDETFKLAISLPADGFAILSGSAEAVGTIEADEAVFKLVRVLAVGELPTVTEGGTARFKIVRTGAADFAATVFYSTLEDSTAGTLRAIAGTDFQGRTGSASFAAGEADSSDFGVFVEAATLNDSVAELDGETFLLRLTSVTNGVVSPLPSESDQSIGINDNDVPPDPRVRILDSFVNEGGNLSFVVSLVTANGAPTTAAYPIRISYQSVLGNAGPGFADAADFPGGFSSSVQTVNFAVGQSSITITVPTNQDSLAERSDTMAMRLLKVEKDFGGLAEISSPFLQQGSTVGQATIEATGTIRNDDTVITVANLSEPEENALNDMTFTATIPVAVPFPVSFHYKTQNGTANSTDFNAAEGDVTIPAGFTAATFTVQMKGDITRETNEQFTVLLTAPSDAVLSATTAIGTIQNDDAGPQLTVSGGQIEEGTGDLIFTVSLTGEISENVTVHFATSDGTARSKGVIQDYVEQNGVITFSPQSGIANQTREIRVTVNSDLWKEGDETVNMTLSDAVGAELLAPNATGTILDGTDSLIGVFLRDSSVVEGGNVVFTLEATALPAQPFSVKLNTRTGSADSSDFSALVDRLVTFSAFSLTTTVTVSTSNDSVFEPSERFFVDATSSNSAAAIVPAGASAQALIYNDDQRIISNREFEFIDEDGDLVNVKVSKGSLFRPNGFGGIVSRGFITLTSAGSVGGSRLDSVNFLGTGSEFAGASLFITRKSQQGFDLPTDGRVNVGEVIAAQAGFASLAQGVNLGTVKIDGDLGRIIAGSNSRSAGVAILELGSLGVIDRSDDGATQSILFGKTGSVLVHGDVEGSMYVVGTNRGIGSLKSLAIQGRLIGGSSEQTGYIFSSSNIGKISVGGIVGGGGDQSGMIFANGKSGTVSIGNILGGAGEGSGRVQIVGDVKSFTAGNIQGGINTNSGSVEVGGKISNMQIANILGSTDSSATMITGAGSVIAGNMGKVSVTGNVTGATAEDNLGGSLSSRGNIASLTVVGTVQDTVLSAAKNIGKVNIGTLRFAEILAGYTGISGRGSLVNADAQIGAVVVNEFVGSSIVAGVSPGNDGLFGQIDDFVSGPWFNVLNSDRVISKIASVTIKNLIATPSLIPTGIAAQNIGPVKVGGVSVPFALEPAAIPGSQIFINVV